jgi:hypothetical protein
MTCGLYFVVVMLRAVVLMSILPLKKRLLQGTALVSHNFFYDVLHSVAFALV